MKTHESWRQVSLTRCAASTILFLTLFATTSTNAQPFSDCDINVYYTSTDINDRTALHSLIQSTHRNVLPYTSSSRADVWDALIDLDSNDNNQVMLIYASRNVTAQDYGTSDTWNREHLWPKSLGVGDNGADFTDVHHLRPSDWNVNAARGNKLFGSCGIVDVEEDCVVPAHSQTADDTATDNVIWLPPANKRGDIARALFYMDLRYDGDATNELDLRLTDCPVNTEVKMGYLSELLKWHQDDPVDSTERARNTRVCEAWQGNRNPFVDYEDLVSTYFGVPQEPNPPHGYTCDGNSDLMPTSGPTAPAVFSDGTCNGLSPGDIMIFEFNSDNPDTVSLVALNEVAAGATLFMTDNAWTGSNFRSNEGTLKYVVGGDGIPARSIFVYTSSSDSNSGWIPEQGSFALAATGDTILLYCLESDDTITHLTALSYSGEWLPESSDETTFGTEYSALPSSLPSNTFVSLPHMDNYIYVGSRQGTTSSLLDSLSNPESWEGSNADMFRLGLMNTKFMDTTSKATTVTWFSFAATAFLLLAGTLYAL